MPAPIIGLIAQPSLEDTNSIGVSTMQDRRGCASFCVSISYTLWSHPADHSDPIKLADLDDEKCASIEKVSVWPRPSWLIERFQRMRYPQLWEAVRTTWNRDQTGHTSLAQQLVGHANYILDNQYRDETSQPGLRPAPLTAKSVNPAITVAVDGVSGPAADIDTDPFVYAIGAETAPNTVVTAVLARSELEYIQIAFAARPVVNHNDR